MIPKKYFSKDLRFMYPSESVSSTVAGMCFMNNLEDRGVTNSLSAFTWLKCMWELKRTRVVMKVGWGSIGGEHVDEMLDCVLKDWWWCSY